MSSRNAQWFVRPRPRPEARWRLIGFPYGGGGPQAFRGWPEVLEESVELLALNLPGRGSRIDEAPIADMDELADAIVEEMRAHVDMPFAFFGHSVGALVAYEVARRMQEAGLPAPLRVFVSAHTAPAGEASRLHATERPENSGSGDEGPMQEQQDSALVAESRSATPMHELADDDLVDVIRDLGLVPDAALEDSELLDLILPPLRADFALSETYDHAGRADSRIDAPLTALGGTEDELATPDDLAAWSTHTSGGFDVVTFEGGHFYTTEHLTDLVRTITDRVEADAAALPDSVLVGPHAEYPRDALLHELFREQAARTPDHVALVDGESRLTYAQLDDQSDLLARDLQARGVGVDSLVGIYMATSAEFVVAYLAALKAGGAYMPLDVTYPTALLTDVLTLADPVAVVASAEIAGALPPEWSMRVVTLDAGWQEALAAADLPPLDPAIRPGPESLAYCVMSSGTTGTPKGIVCPHRGAVNSYHWRYRHLPYEADEREASNVFFVWEVLRPLLQGQTAHVIPDEVIFDPPKLVELLHRERITRVLFTPSLLDQVLGTPGLDLAQGLEHLRVLYLNGEVVTTALARRVAQVLPWVRLINDYSISEAHDVCTTDLADLDPTLSPRYAPLGVPMDNVRIVLLDENGRAVPRGFSGELYVGGDSLARGYLGAPAATQERFVPDPQNPGERLFRTGDAGRILANGQVEVQGRIAFMVKLRGYSIVPGAVEAAITSHPAVESAVVTTQDDPETGQPEHLVAHVVGNGTLADDALAQAVRSHLRTRLAPYAIPSFIVPMAQMPLAATGKLDRRELPAPPPVGAASSALLDPPTTSTERQVAAAWSQALHVEAVEAGVNFFDVGGHSLAAAAVCAHLREEGVDVSVIDVFTYPTIRLLSAHLDEATGAGVSDDPTAETEAPPASARPRTDQPGAHHAEPIAVVGVAARFPGAPDADAFWRNIRGGVRAIRELSAEELAERGVPEEISTDPDYRAIGAIVDDVESFEPAFWGVSAKEAQLMDPQHRLFLEACWHALENAGYAPRTGGSRTGVFGGVFLPTYLLHQLRGGALLDPRDPMEAHLTEIGNDKDYVTTRVSHLLDLRGPSVAIQTSCSTALVAVSAACQSLQSGACDTALAGASSLTFPQAGYLYAEGHIASHDGFVRPFDAKASGTILGDGVGVVVLKRLADAEAAGDTILAVISGHATNNDGNLKAGYSAPSVQGQAEVVAAAQQMAGADPDTFSYLECHGTGTLVGDPIEVRALTGVFRRSTDRRGFCAIGSVKAGIGHSNIAAGMAGLISTVLALHHRQMPPLIGFETPNPALELETSPFYINTELRPWEPDGETPRRAGVSCFGIGGTNAHLVLEGYDTARSVPTTLAQEEEGPAAVEDGTGTSTSPATHGYSTAPIHPQAGDAGTDAPATAAATDGQISAAPVIGDRVETQTSTDVHAPAGASAESPTVDSTAAAHGAHLLTLSARTPASVRQAAADLADHLEATAPDADALIDAAATLARGRERFAHRLAVAGTDAASLSAALRSATPHEVVTGGGLVFAFPGQGAQYLRMGEGLYQHIPEFRRHYDACSDLLTEHGIDLRAVAFGEDSEEFMRAHHVQPAMFAVEYSLAQTLIAWGLRPSALVGHSLGEYVAACVGGMVSLQDAILLVLARAHAMEEAGPGAMLSVKLDPDQAADLVADDPAVDVAVVNSPGDVVLSGEVAAVEALETRLAEQGVAAQRLHTTRAFHSPMMEAAAARVAAQAAEVTLHAPSIPVLSNLTGDWFTDDLALDPEYWGRHLRGTVRFADNAAALLALAPQAILEVGPGRTLSGLVGTAARAAGSTPPVSIPLMRHPMEDAGDAPTLLSGLGRAWCAGVEPAWTALHGGPRRRVPLPGYAFDGVICRPPAPTGPLAARPTTREGMQPFDDWFSIPSWRRTLPPVPVEADMSTQTDWLVLKLNDQDEFAREIVDDIEALLRDHAGPSGLVMKASQPPPDMRGDLEQLLEDLACGDQFPSRILVLWPFDSPSPAQDILYLTQALSTRTEPVDVWIVTEHTAQVVPEEFVIPERAALLGPALVVAQENPQITCRVIDVPASDAADVLRREFAAPSRDSLVAWRGRTRWVPSYEPVRLPTGASRLTKDGVYLVTGGLGRIGLVLADHLVGLGARVILTTRHDEDSLPADTIQQLVALRERGEVVVVTADPTEHADVGRMLRVAHEEFGRLDGIFHAAGLADLAYLPDLTPDRLEAETAPKVTALRHLQAEIADLPREQRPGFVVLFSSIAAVLGGLAMGAYMGANRAMDTLAQAEPSVGGVDWVVVNWDDWDFDYGKEQIAAYAAGGVDRYAMSPEQGLEALDRILALREPVQVLVSTRPLAPRLAQWVDQHRVDASGDDETSGAGSGTLVEQVQAVYEAVLGVPDVGPDDDFFALGGDSLLAAQLLARLRQDVGVDAGVRLPDVFARPTPAHLAARLGEQPEPTAPTPEE